MKKIVLSLLAVVLMSFGLVVGTAPAQAAPYPGTVDVAAPAKLPGKVKSNKKAKIPLAAPGNAGVPIGTAKVVCKNGKSKVVRTGNVKDGVVKSAKLGKRGKWICNIHYTATPGSVYKSAVKAQKLKVVVKVKR